MEDALEKLSISNNNNNNKAEKRNPYTGRPYSDQYYELLQKRKTLPVYASKDNFVKLLKENQVCKIIIVNTNCYSCFFLKYILG